MILFHCLLLAVSSFFHRLVFGLDVCGRENLRAIGREGCVVVANHSLYLDPPIILWAMRPSRVLFVAQRSHFSNPVGSFFLKILGAMRLPEAFDDFFALAREGLRRGYWVAIFPEGKMTHRGQDPLRFRQGAFRLARENHVPVLPVTLVHWPRRLFGMSLGNKFRRVRCAIGTPIWPTREEGETEHHATVRMASEARQQVRDMIHLHTPSSQGSSVS